MSGSAYARFELSTLPEHIGKRVVVMRIIKFVEPVTCIVPDYDGRMPFPREGELFHRGGQRHPRLFVIDIDRDVQASHVLKHLAEGSWTSPASSRKFWHPTAH